MCAFVIILQILNLSGTPFEVENPPICSTFRCHIGNCLNSSQICNSIADCSNNEDENSIVCLKTEPKCKQHEIKCRNGACVPKTSFCDSTNDCGDFSDEPDNCTCAEYLKLAHSEQICDSEVNCFDNSDEMLNCPCRPSYFNCKR